jgi:hypothetical protein
MKVMYEHRSIDDVGVAIWGLYGEPKPLTIEDQKFIILA